MATRKTFTIAPSVVEASPVRRENNGAALLGKPFAYIREAFDGILCPRMLRHLLSHVRE
jgi:hypothetical protein